MEKCLYIKQNRNLFYLSSDVHQVNTRQNIFNKLQNNLSKCTSLKQFKIEICCLKNVI